MSATLIAGALFAFLAAADIPNDQITPGAILPGCTVETMCRPNYSRSVRHTSGKLKARVYRAYGIGAHLPCEYEVDHRVPLEICGADAFENLWPQSYRAEPWNAYRKDRVENEARRRVCAGKLSLEDAQAIFLGDWRATYSAWFGGAR